MWELEDKSWGVPLNINNIPDDACLAVVRDYNGEYGIDKVVVPAEYWNGMPATIGDSSNPINPQPQFDHCEYCGTKTFPTDRCCVACGAPV